MARVLHIDHDPHDRRRVERLLAAAGHEVVECGSGLQGIRLASTEKPDLVLVDANVPDLDGFEVTLRLRGMSSLRGVPIVAITGDSDRQKSLAVGADGSISKPIDEGRFASTIALFLDGHRERIDGTGEIQLREQSQRIVEHLERKVVELLAANARLEEMVRLRREFLQNVSHELATPMTPVVGYLRLLLNEELGPLTQLQRKCLASIESSTARLRSAVDTLLDVSSLETGRMHYYVRPYDFSEVTMRAVEQLRARFEQNNVRVEISVPQDEWHATGDPDKLLRAVVHVLDNAAKFTPPGGTVALEAGEGDGYYELFVADSGPGVRPEDLERVMEPFYQADGSATRTHGGAGLGLAFARRVTAAMGGGVEIVSPPNRKVAGEQLGGTLARLWVQLEPKSKSSSDAQSGGTAASEPTSRG